MQGNPSGEAPRRAFAENDAMPLWDGVGLALGVGIVYFLGARLSLALLTKPDGVAVFWPAAGISAGILIAFGPRVRWPVAIGVMAATVAANLLGDRNLAATVVFALCNAGEAILIAWVIRHHFGPGFSLDSVHNVLGLFAAATVAITVSGVGGTAGFALFHNSGTPFLATWLNWLASDALGVLTVAPLVIGLAGVLHNRPGKSEAAEGLLLLALLALGSGVSFVSPTSHWFTILPGTLTLPLLLWLTARCRPAFAAGSVFIPALAIVCGITFGIGRLGDPNIPVVDRVYAAQAALLALSLCALVLAAVFAERRAHVAALKDSNHRLQLALDCAELGTWSFHLKTGLFENDVRDRSIHGHGLQLQTLGQMRSQVHPEDLGNLDAAFLTPGRADGSFRTEYRLAPRTDQECNGRERWVALQGGVVRDTVGQPVQLLGVTQDITEPKHAEARLQESERSLRELLGALPAAIYVTDTADHITYCNEGAVNLWGARPKLGEDRWSDVSRLYHADGRPMALEDCGRAVRGREAILERADGSRIPIIPYPTLLRDATGAIVGVVNMTVDISERKKAEQALAERNAQLALAGRAALVGSYAYDVNTEVLQISEGYAAIHGLPEGTTETALSQWRERVHPEDLERVEGLRDQIFGDRRKEYTVEYRIIRPEGEVRWIERRSSISYGGAGGPERVIGVTIDVTERKRTEALLKDSNARLSDALAAGQVVAFEWDAGTGRSQRSDNAERVIGFVEDGHFLRQVHPDDRNNFRTLIRGLPPANASYALTFRFVRPDGRQVWLEETARGEFDGKGRLLRIKGLTRDVTERELAEQILAERNAQLSLAGKAGLVGAYAYDADREVMQISEGYAAIHGFPEGTAEIARSKCLAGVHSEDIERVQQCRDDVFCKGSREYSVEYRIIRPDGQVRWVETRCFISYERDGRPQRVIGVSIDITERKIAEERQRILHAELDHRVKNVLATVSAVVSHTREGNRSIASFAAALEGRIGSMATTHELLSSGRWQGISLTELVRRELAPYAINNNTEINGAEVELKSEAGQAMAMVLHELTTNAAKYGALSTKKGRVSIRWAQRDGHSRSNLVLEWQEIGGPPVVAAGKPSYGTSTIRDLIPYEFGGTVDLVLAPEGVRCQLELPADWLSNNIDRVPGEGSRAPL